MGVKMYQPARKANRDWYGMRKRGGEMFYCKMPDILSGLLLAYSFYSIFSNFLYKKYLFYSKKL